MPPSVAELQHIHSLTLCFAHSGFAWCGAANAGAYCGSKLYELMIYSAAHCNTAIESQNSNLNTEHVQMHS